MKIRIILFIVNFGVWTMLNWVPDKQHLIVGIFVACAVTFLTADLFEKKPSKLKNPLRYLYFILYVPLFLWECIKANFDVAYRVLHPARPLKPGIVAIKTSLKSDMGITFLANSITLTPGTMTVGIDRERGLLYVHWISVKGTDIETATRYVSERFEKILKRIFD